MSSKLKKNYHKFLNMYKSFRFQVYKIKHKDKYKLIKKNKKYKNIHKNQRCFILGNGPSLQQIDFSLLKDEYVFTVNQISRNKNFSSLSTNYHFWADPMFFVVDDVGKGEEDMIKVMLNVEADSSPECFFPIQQKEFIENNSLTENLKVNYFYSGYSFHDNYNRNIDYTKIVPGFGTVVQWAITMAIYMGFSEIYLLGCDNTGILVTVNSALKRDTENCYSYSFDEKEKLRIEQLLKKHSLEDYCRSYLSTLEGYRHLYNYCLKRNIKLMNCSSETVIDSIPRVWFDEIINER